MKVKIEYKSDGSDAPYCAFTNSLPDYECAWSTESFEEAKQRLIACITNPRPSPPQSEEVEI